MTPPAAVPFTPTCFPEEVHGPLYAGLVARRSPLLHNVLRQLQPQLAAGGVVLLRCGGDALGQLQVT